MAQKIGLKSTDKEGVARLLSLTADDISNTSADELVGMLALLHKRKDDISTEADSLKESSGINALDNEASRIKELMLQINHALVVSNFFNETNEQVMVNIHKEDVVSVFDGDETRYETEDVIDASSVMVKQSSYYLKDGINFDDLLNKLAELGIISSVRLGTLRFTELTPSEFLEVKECLRRFGLLDALSINKTSFNSDMKLYPDKRQVLIDSGFVAVDSSIKVSKATNRQLSLFGDESEIGLDVVPVDVVDEE